MSPWLRATIGNDMPSHPMQGGDKDDAFVIDEHDQLCENAIQLTTKFRAAKNGLREPSSIV